MSCYPGGPDGFIGSGVRVGEVGHRGLDVAVPQELLENLGRDLRGVVTADPLPQGVHRQPHACLAPTAICTVVYTSAGGSASASPAESEPAHLVWWGDTGRQV